ncbi:MAG TPA: hypothetical protein VIN08_27165 [Ohtaekwangia sp.]|uniref:hypothetical protein n=1 Tax=Ohtaekwangia sp. TaxID=2066019 RepID=UPI002F92C776
METSNRNISFFFIAVAIVIFIGFFKTYFGLFPFFSGVDAFHHFHAIVLITWLVLLIVQPILIQQKKFRLHRWLGKFSYFLVPFIVASMLMAYRVQYFRLDKLGISKVENLGLLFTPFTDIFPFVTFYILAIVNVRNTPAHVRYIVATALIVVGAGIVRTLTLLVKFDDILTYFLTSIIITALLFMLFILLDLIKGKAVLKNPMTLAFLVFLIPNALFFVIPQTAWWQTIAAGIVKIM